MFLNKSLYFITRDIGGGAGYHDLMIGTLVSSPKSSPMRQPRVEMPVHHSSHRLQGLGPEFGLLKGPTLPTTTPARDMAFSRSPAQGEGPDYFMATRMKMRKTGLGSLNG